VSAAVVLVIDDEVQVRRFLDVSLRASGYVVHEANTGESGLEQAALLRPDIVVLDLNLPDMNGLTVLKRLREWSQVPVIVLSVRGADADKIALLDSGADDYLTKPFSIGELLARLRVLLRHLRSTTQSPVFRSGRLMVDLSRRQVEAGGEPVRLTATEYAFLRLLVQHAGRVLTHRHILREVWGPEYEEETQYLRVYVAQLRKKLEADPANPGLILTEPGVGYRLADEEAEAGGAGQAVTS
jgi:two-component system, OmpR family, KDP operon response regulator KdpE